MSAAAIAEYEFQLEQISGALEADSENDELLTLKNELSDLIRLTKSQLEASNEVSASTVTAGAPDERKRKHDAVEVRKVGDQVLAKWITGDHQFYNARITSITGNRADPVYTVKFLDYNEVQTLHSHQIRSMNEHKKRALESGHVRNTAATPPPPPPSTDSPGPPPPLSKLSSPAPSTTSATATKKKSSAKEDLAKTAASWSNFAKTGPKTKSKVGKRKAIGESSMFRTDENGRVGVIGSGRAMTSDPGKRGRHVFDPDR